MLELVRLPGEICRDVGEYRLLAQVVADQVGNEWVDPLVVGHSVADRVGDGDGAPPGGAHQPGHPEQAVLAKGHRVEELVADPPVDDMDPFQPTGGAHIHVPVVDQQVTAFDQLHSHLAGQEGMLEIGGVGDTGGEHDHGGVRDHGRCDRPQRAQERSPVVVDRADAMTGEADGEHPGHRHPVLEDVGDPTGDPKVVLEHPVHPVAVPDDVDPRDHTAPAAGHRDPMGVADVPVGGIDQPLWHDPVLDRRLASGVQVVEEPVEDGDPLHQSLLDVRPLLGRDDPRHEVHGPCPLQAGLVPAQGERDPQGAEEGVEKPGAHRQVLVSDLLEPIHEQPIVGADSIRPLYLVEAAHGPSVLTAVFRDRFRDRADETSVRRWTVRRC